MITKKLSFDDSVLDVLRKADIQQENGVWILILRSQLERNLYLSVNKALEKMGGKWNRKAGGHVFPDDPRLQVEGLIDSGELVVELDGFFETPPAVITRMIALVTPRPPVLEPSAGLGAIANALVNTGFVSVNDIFCIERNPERYERLLGQGFIASQMDFLELKPLGFYSTVFMNPPFERGQDIDHVRHAFEFLKPSGRLVSVISEGTFFRDDKKTREFNEWLGYLDTGIEKLPEGSFKSSETMVRARLLVIER